MVPVANGSVDFIDTLGRPAYGGAYGTPREDDILAQAEQIGRQRANADFGAMRQPVQATAPNDPFKDPIYKHAAATRSQLADQERLYRQRVSDFDKGEGADLRPFRDPDPNALTSKYPSKFDYLGAQEAAKWTGDSNINPPAVRQVAAQKQLLADRRQRLVDEANRISQARQKFDNEQFLPLRSRLLRMGPDGNQAPTSAQEPVRDYLAPTGDDALSQRIREIQLRRESTGEAPLRSGSVSGSGRFDETWAPVNQPPQDAKPDLSWVPKAWMDEPAESAGAQTSDEPRDRTAASPDQIPEISAYTPPSLAERAKEGLRDFLSPLIGESDRQKMAREVQQQQLESMLPGLANLARQSGNTTFQEQGLSAAPGSFHEAAPLVGSDAAGTKGLLGTLPKVEGDDVVAGMANAANRFTSGLTTPENIALAGVMEGVNGVRAAAPAVKLAARAAQAGASAIFAGQGVKGAYEAAKQAVEAVKDPNTTKADVAQAITSGLLNLGLAAGAGHGTLEAGKAGLRELGGKGGSGPTPTPETPSGPPTPPPAGGSSALDTSQMLADLEAQHALNRNVSSKAEAPDTTGDGQVVGGSGAQVPSVQESAQPKSALESAQVLSREFPPVVKSAQESAQAMADAEKAYRDNPLIADPERYANELRQELAKADEQWKARVTDTAIEAQRAAAAEPFINDATKTERTLQSPQGAEALRNSLAEQQRGKPMPEDWRVTVWKMSPELPPAIQIDKIGHDGASLGSFSPEELRKEGYAVPEVAQLPQGQYHAGDLSQHLEANPPSSTTEPTSGGQPNANVTGPSPINDQPERVGIPSGSDLRPNEGEVREGNGGQAGGGGGTVERPRTPNEGGGEVGSRGLPAESRAPNAGPNAGRSDAGVRGDVTPAGLAPHAGWKLHLATDDPESVSAKLKEIGLTHKVGRNAGQGGKDLTVYVGSKNAAINAAKIINDQAGSMLKPPTGDTIHDDISFGGKVMGRFDAAGDKDFHQYGANGVPHLIDDVQAGMFGGKGPSNMDERADAVLKYKYGEFYTGTSEAAPRGPGFISGTAAEQWADAKLKERSGQVSAGLDPELVAAHAIKGAAIMERGVRDFGAWSKEMVRQFGDTIKPHLDAIWQQTQSAVQGRQVAGVPPSVNATIQSVGIRQRIANAVAKGDLKDAIVAGRDAVDNKANLYGREHTNEIKNAANKVFAKSDRGMVGDALTFAVEAGAKDSELKAMGAKIAASDKAAPADAQRALAAIQYARDHLEQMKPLVDQYNTKTSQQLEAERIAGKDTPQYRNYVPHRQEVDDLITQLFGGDRAGGSNGAAGFRHIRDFPTYADSIAAGISPKSLNAFDLLQSRLSAGQKIINMGAWMDGLREMKDPASGQSVLRDMDRIARTNGPTDIQAPKGYKGTTINGRQVAVKEGYEGLLHKMVDPGFWANDRVGRAIQQANAIGKSTNLLLDSFHLGRLAYWNAATRLNAGGLLGGGVDVPNPLSYKSGHTLLDSTPADIVRRGQEDGLTQAQIRDRLNDKRVLDMGVNTGLNVGRISDALYQDLFHHALEKTGPVGKGITGFQKWLFDDYQRGAMSEIYLMEFRRQRAMSGNAELPDITLARRVAKEVNTRFGNLGRQGIFKSRAGQDIARLLVLAPQWNEGLIRSELHGALIDPVSSVAKAAIGKGLATSMLSRSMVTAVVGQFVANQLINQYTRGKFTWENPEEGMGAKLSAWIPDKIGGGPGFFLHPMSIGAEISHLISQRWEKTGSAREALDSFTRSRLSSAARPAATFMLKTNSMGKTLRPQDVNTEALKEAVPLPIPTRASVGAARSMLTGERSETFPGQFQKQIMSTVGMKTDQAPSDEQRIYGLASEYQRAKGIQQDNRNDVSDYTPLYTALRVGNRSDADTAMRDLLAKRTAKQVFQSLQQHPRRAFSGKASNEADFVRSLNPEQRMTYNRAKQQRADLSNRAIALLRDYIARHPEANAPVQQ